MTAFFFLSCLAMVGSLLWRTELEDDLVVEGLSTSC